MEHHRQSGETLLADTELKAVEQNIIKSNGISLKNSNKGLKQFNKFLLGINQI